MNELVFVYGCLGEIAVLHDKIEGKFIGKLVIMTRRMLRLKYWTNQPNVKMLKIAEENGEVKRETLVKTESAHKMNNRFKT